MRSVTRAARHGHARQAIGPPVQLPTLRRQRGAGETAAAASDLSAELLRSALSPELARRALDQFRRRAHASTVIFWTIVRSSAMATLSSPAQAADLPPRELTCEATIRERLRRRDVLICRAGDNSGIEPLVPDGARSFLMVAAPGRGDTSGVLIVGWDASTPAADHNCVAPLRIAASTLLWATKRHDPIATLPETILRAIAHPIAVVDVDGTVSWVNNAWSQFSVLVSAFESVQAGSSYFECCRRAAAEGGTDFAELRDGIQAVARGERARHQATFRFPAPGGEEWVLVQATAMPQPSRGAVIVHHRLAPDRVSDLTAQLGERHFYDLIDALPIPIWIHGTDGRVIHGNTAWRHITNLRVEGDTGRWFDLFHPLDRARVRSIFAPAAEPPAAAVEVRMRAADGTYRWSMCAGAAVPNISGRGESFVGCGIDAGAARQSDTSPVMLHRLANAQEEERIRIARELHDDLGQQAAVLATKIGALATAREHHSARLKNALRDADRHVQDLAASIHHLSHQLHPPRLKLLGLVKTLDAMCRDVSKQRNMRVRFQSTDVPSNVAEPIALNVCRVAQEAVRNAVKHSGTHEIDVCLSAVAQQLTLTVTDRGRGFDPETTRTPGIGLQSMRERIEVIGGRFTIDTAPSMGTRITATLPLV
jgi:PAS domain S-box-containing protein